MTSGRTTLNYWVVGTPPQLHAGGVGRQQQQDEGETDCHKDCDKGSYTVMKYDTTKCICTYVQG